MSEYMHSTCNETRYYWPCDINYSGLILLWVLYLLGNQLVGSIPSFKFYWPG